MSNTPELEEVLQQLFQDNLGDLSVGFPAKVQAVSEDGTRVDVVPMVKQPAIREDGSNTGIELPVLSNVPYGSIRMGNFEIVVPAEVGAFVRVDVADFDFSKWLVSGKLGDLTEFGSHVLSNAMAFPYCIQPNGNPIPAGEMSLGHTACKLILRNNTIEAGGNTDSGALSSKVDAIVAAITGAAITPAADGGASFKAGILAILNAPPGWGTSASTILKVGG